MLLVVGACVMSSLCVVPCDEDETMVVLGDCVVGGEQVGMRLDAEHDVFSTTTAADVVAVEVANAHALCDADEKGGFAHA